MKGKVKRIVSGVLSVMTLLASAVQPAPVYALETGTLGYEAEFPAFEQVKDRLDADEAVTVEDLEVEADGSFDAENDFSGITFDAEKVKVKFHEAADRSGSRFDGKRTGSYRAVYFVKPSSGHPSYHICRNIVVKKPVAENQAEKNPDGSDRSGRQEDAGSGDEEDGSDQLSYGLETFTVDGLDLDGRNDADKTGEEDIPAADEAAGQADTETGLTVEEAMSQAGEQGIDLLAMDEGESAVFYASAGGRAEEKVTVTRGDCFRYADFGLGTYLTYRYTVRFGDVAATAYCVQPSKDSPDSGTFSITKLKDKKGLSKVCYYGTKASGEEGFFAEKYPDFPYAKRFILVHMAASHANGSEDAFSGASSTGRELAMELYEYCMAQPEIPDVEMSFSSDSVTAYVEGNIQRTKEIVFKGDELQSVTMKLPEGVKFHNVDTGKTSRAGADIEVTGGTRFYLSAPLTQAEDVSAEWSARMKGSITKDYSAYKISTGSGSQDLALVFGEGVTDEKYVEFSVSWIEPAKVRVVKVDSKNQGARLSGAVFGVYEDKECTKLITRMPATNSSGADAVKMIKTQDTVYLKEITAPEGYGLNTSAYKVKLDDGGTVTTTVPDEELLGGLTVYKEGQVLSGADSSAEGTVFRYENRRLPGAVFSVYAGADIVTAYGTKVFSRGDLVRQNLVTGADGSASMENLHAGTYVVRETKAPENFYNAGEEKTVTVSAAGQDAEAAFSEITFTDERQKAEVSILKKDRDTDAPLGGVIFGLYAAESIRSVDGLAAADRGTLIEKVQTGTDGRAEFLSDLPVGFSYSVKEEQAPAGYVLGTDVYDFRFSYTSDKEAEVSFSHAFTNKRASAKITVHKKDAETGRAVPQGDASLEKAVYGLYAREDIMRPDGSGTAYRAGEQAASLTTGRNGEASVDNLYLGKYFVKEITPPVGYLADTKEYDFLCSYEGDMTAEVERECTSLEQVKKQPFQIIKAGYNGDTDVGLLAGAGFTAYLKSSLAKNADGSYDFSSAQPAVIGKHGETEIFTDEKGYACSAALPYGTYIVRETTTPHNYKPVKDFTVRITENSPDTPQMWRVLFDEEFTAKLKIIKQDNETKKAVLVKGAEFKIYDLDRGRYVEQVTTYPVTVLHKSYFTDENGYLILPQNLGAGRYRIEEVHAPYGYTQNPDSIDVADHLFWLQINLIDCHKINRYNDIIIEKEKVPGHLFFAEKDVLELLFKPWLLYQNTKQNTMRLKIFLITSKEECICPCCGGRLKYRDHRLRIHKAAGGGKEWCRIRRLKCTNGKCGRLHNELPDCMFPYKHYDTGLIEDVVDGIVSADDLETEDYPCEGTIRHWKWWARMNEKNMEGQMRSAAHRFLDFGTDFLKSEDPLLEGLKERISPGWLKAAARFIYNSGGRTEPHPQAV